MISVSSIINTSNYSCYNTPLFYRSNILPGVPITTSTPLLILSICCYISFPPYTAKERYSFGKFLNL